MSLTDLKSMWCGRRAGWYLGVLIVLGGGTAVAQDGPLPTDSLRAEVSAVAPMFTTDRGIRLRFALVNASDEPATLPLFGATPAKGGWALPLPLVLGFEQPWLSVTYEDEPPKSVPVPPLPTADDTNPPGPAFLQLAPHGLVGLEIDLQQYYSPCRYPGTYRVEWRPLDGRAGVATATFRVESRRDAILVTDYGKATFVLNYEGAPVNVANFLELTRQGFYEGKILHRIVPGFVIQGGCSNGDGTGIRPDGRLVPGEFHPDVPIELGTLLMARRPSDPNSASCQFFIALARLPELDGQYTVLGRAADDESLRTLLKLAAVPGDNRDRPLAPVTIRSINLVDAEQNRARRLEVRRATGTSGTAADSLPSP